MLFLEPKYKIDKRRQIYFIKKDYQNAKLQVKISRNFKKVVLAYGKDCYELSEMNGEYTQRMISWLNKKGIASIISTGDEFMFLVHK